MTVEQAAATIELLYGSPLSAISDCLRSFIVPAPGKRFLICDFSSIEARVLAWLAGQEDVLEIFRKGGDLYKVAASKIYRIPVESVSKDQRQIGKVAVLALGYGGGKGAFQAMARGYGVKVSDRQADEIKKAWRYGNQKIEKYWWECEDAAKMAIKRPGQKWGAGAAGRGVGYLVKGSFLFCRLPSGRVLSYPYPKIVEDWAPWDSSRMIETIRYKGQYTSGSKFEELKTYGGSLVENITQAVARDLLAEAMLRLEEHGYEIVAHVHDETVCEVPFGVGSVQEMERIMCVLPEWGRDLPLAAEGFESMRYRK
jgi:DNA polymerase